MEKPFVCKFCVAIAAHGMIFPREKLEKKQKSPRFRLGDFLDIYL